MSALAQSRPRNVSTTKRHSSLAQLLTRYLAGHIDESQWSSISDTLDEIDASADERDAYAAFCLDASRIGGDVAVPNAEEVSTMLAMTRF